MNSLVKVPPYSKLNFEGKIFFIQNWCNITLECNIKKKYIWNKKNNPYPFWLYIFFIVLFILKFWLLAFLYDRKHFTIILCYGPLVNVFVSMHNGFCVITPVIDEGSFWNFNTMILVTEYKLKMIWGWYPYRFPNKRTQGAKKMFSVKGVMRFLSLNSWGKMHSIIM